MVKRKKILVLESEKLVCSTIISSSVLPYHFFSFNKSLLQNCDIHFSILSMKLTTGKYPYWFLIEWIYLI